MELELFVASTAKRAGIKRKLIMKAFLFIGQKRDENKEPRPCKQGRDPRRAMNAVVPHQQNEEDCASEVGEQRNPRSSVGASVPSRPADGWPAGFSATHRVVDQRV